jgi:hypothetical protein
MSEVSICNSALIKIGASRIASLTEDSKEAKLCYEQYPILRDEVQASHPWNFCIKRVVLALLPSTPAFGFDYEFQLPNDCLRVVELDTKHIDYQVESDKLLCNEQNMSIKYIARIEDTTKFSPMFISALSHRIAADLAYPLVQSNTLARDMKQMYAVILSEAKTADAQEGTPPVLIDDTWLTSRY